MLFIGTFFICLFIFMMQFLWRYVDELVGKGVRNECNGSVLLLFCINISASIVAVGSVTGFFDYFW